MTKEEIMQENTRLAAEHKQVHEYNDQLGRENQGLKRQVRALEDSRALWKREWRLSEDGEKKSMAYIKTLEDDRTLAALNIAGYKHALNSCHKVIFELEGQRRQDAIDGQMAMEESNNMIVHLTDRVEYLDNQVELLANLLDHREKQYHELLFGVSKKWPGETRHETALRYILRAENPGPAVPKYSGPIERNYCL